MLILPCSTQSIRFRPALNVPTTDLDKGLEITQWDMHAVEDAGLIKIDILGQKGLAVISDTIRQVERNEGLRILGCLWDSSIFPGRAPAGTLACAGNVAAGGPRTREEREEREGEAEEQRLTVFFEGDRLVRVTGDFEPQDPSLRG